MQLITDEYGGVYSADGKILLKCPNQKWYRVREGVEELAPDALHDAPLLEELDLPYTIDQSNGYFGDRYENDVTEEEYQELEDWECDLYEKWGYDKEAWPQDILELYLKQWYDFWPKHKCWLPISIQRIMFWDMPYSDEDKMSFCCDHDLIDAVEDEYGAVYSRNGRRLLSRTDKFDAVTEYTVREGVITICDQFLDRGRLWYSGIPFIIHLPASVTVIDKAFLEFYQRSGNDLIATS